MTVGTKVVQKALGHISVYSPLQPANPESLEFGKDTLNSMLASWEDEYNINMGTVPLDEIGDELSEPLGARNNIEYCLAVQLAPSFPGAQVSPVLLAMAKEGFENIRRTFSEVDIPKQVVRSTLPIGQGNKRQGNTKLTRTFFPEDSEIG